MEREGCSSQPKICKYSRRPKSAGVAIQESNAAPALVPAPTPAPTLTPTSAPAPAASVPDLNPPPGFKREPDQYIPIANVVRIMRRILPPNARIADDAKETIQECVSEFIGFITTEANKNCHREYRRTVTPDDVLTAMGSLGFDNYVEILAGYLNKYRANDPERRPIPRVPVVRRPPSSFVQQPAAQRPRPATTPEMTVGYVSQPPSSCDYSELPPMTGFFMGNQSGGEGASKDTEE